jgi:hypothetical protein
MMIFAVTHSEKLQDAVLFSAQEKAEAYLRKLRAERRGRGSVTVVEDTPTVFGYTMGWEEHRVTFKIVELTVL